MSTNPPVAESSRSSRLLSIDALRGFDMFWIMGADTMFRALGRWWGPPLEPLTEKQLEHAAWEGFRFYDLIFPLFLFLVGVVIPFSVRSHARRGESNVQIGGRIARRVVLLVGLGMVCNGLLMLDFANLRYAGVLQRIGLCYGVAAVLGWRTGVRTQAITLVSILLGYWLLLAAVPAPGGRTGDLSPEGNLSGYIDRTVLPGKILKEYYGYGDNEGLLSTIPAVATTLLGALAGAFLLSDRTPWRKVALLGISGAVCVATGFAWSLSFPIIKHLWTSSFVLVAGGYSLLLLAVFYALIDVLGYRRWAFFFAVIGANAITIYVVPRFIDFGKMSTFFLSGVARLSGEFSPVLLALGVLGFKWLFLYYLYRRGLFLRV